MFEFGLGVVLAQMRVQAEMEALAEKQAADAHAEAYKQWMKMRESEPLQYVERVEPEIPLLPSPIP